MRGISSDFLNDPPSLEWIEGIGLSVRNDDMEMSTRLRHTIKMIAFRFSSRGDGALSA